MGVIHMSFEHSSNQGPAWDKILEHSPRLKLYISAMVRDYHLAGETLSDVQDTIVKTWERYDPQRQFWPWAKEIARRVAIAKLRERSGSKLLYDPEVIDLLVDEVPTGDAGCVAEWKQALDSCVKAMAGRHRRMIEFRYYQEKDYPEIAGLVGRSVKTLYVIYHRLRELLRDCVLKKLKNL